MVVLAEVVSVGDVVSVVCGENIIFRCRLTSRHLVENIEGTHLIVLRECTRCRRLLAFRTLVTSSESLETLKCRYLRWCHDSWPAKLHQLVISASSQSFHGTMRFYTFSSVFLAVVAEI